MSGWDVPAQRWPDLGRFIKDVSYRPRDVVELRDEGVFPWDLESLVDIWPLLNNRIGVGSELWLRVKVGRSELAGRVVEPDEAVANEFAVVLEALPGSCAESY